MVVRAVIARHHVSQDTAVRIEDAIALGYLINTPWTWKCSLVGTRLGENGAMLVCTLPRVVLKLAYATHATNLVVIYR
jgi:hypothetical protein